MSLYILSTTYDGGAYLNLITPPPKPPSTGDGSGSGDGSNNAPAPPPYKTFPLSGLSADTSCLKYWRKVLAVDYPSWWDALMQPVVKEDLPVPAGFYLQNVYTSEYLVFNGSELSLVSKQSQAALFITPADWSAVQFNAADQEWVGKTKDVPASGCNNRAKGHAVEDMQAFIASLDPNTLVSILPARNNQTSIVAFAHDVDQLVENCPSGVDCWSKPPKKVHFDVTYTYFYYGLKQGNEYNGNSFACKEGVCGTEAVSAWNYACYGVGGFFIYNYSQAASSPKKPRPASPMGDVTPDQLLRLTEATEVKCVAPPAKQNGQKPQTPASDDTLDKYKKYILYGGLGLGAIVLLVVAALLLAALRASHNVAKQKAALQATLAASAVGAVAPTTKR